MVLRSTMAVATDFESGKSSSEKDAAKLPEVERGGGVEVHVGERERLGGLEGVLALLERRGKVELRGSMPVPYEERTVTQYWNIFSLWFCISCNPLP